MQLTFFPEKISTAFSYEKAVDIFSGVTRCQTRKTLQNYFLIARHRKVTICHGCR